MDNTPSYIKIREMERLLQRNFKAPWERALDKTVLDIHQEQVQLATDQMYLALRQYKAERTQENLVNIVKAKRILETLGYKTAILGTKIDGTLSVRNDIWDRIFAPALKAPGSLETVTQEPTPLNGGEQ